MNRDAYEARVMFERWQARIWLAEKLLEARRRYWTFAEDPIRLEDAARAERAGWLVHQRAAMTVLDPRAFVPIVTVAE